MKVRISAFVFDVYLEFERKIVKWFSLNVFYMIVSEFCSN